jgi:methionyl-tRNA formyltransferase
MRLLMMGTGPFAVPTFRALLDSAHDVACLVTRPTPPPVGRRKSPANPMRDLAQQRGLAVLAPENINDPAALAEVRAFAPDLLVVCDYGQILSPDALAVAPLGGINLHASLLPKYRGSAPINWAIYRGEVETGVSVIHITPQLDGGNVLAIERTPIGPEETAAELEPRLAALGVAPVLATIERLAAWDRTAPLGTPQDPALVTKARRLRKTDAEVKWSRSARQIQRQVRAFQPWPGTFTLWPRGGGEPIRLVLDKVTPLDDVPAAAPPGVVTHSDRQQLWVATGQGTLRIDRLQPAGKRVMEAAEFLRGHPLTVGAQLGG